MSTITAILEPDADGSLHLPLPPELRTGKVMVVATLNALEPNGVPAVGFGSLAGKIRMAPDFDEPLEDFKEHME